MRKIDGWERERCGWRSGSDSNNGQNRQDGERLVFEKID